MEHALILALAALALVAATNLLASRLPVPAPVVQTVAGIALAFVPGIPAVHFDPDFVLLVVLPPLVYAAAVKLPWEDFRNDIRAISTLAFGLVAATVVVVAVVAHAIIPGLPWAAAAVLGAIVSPTDPVASTALASRIGIPQRLVAILEGEGLVNDAVALTIKTIAVGALLGSSAGFASGLLRFCAIVIGEIAYGWALGWVIAAIRRRIADSSTEIIVTLITPFAAYLVPASLGGSGVLATVATGMYIGEQMPGLVPSGTRLHLTSVWAVIVDALNGALFLLTGLQLRAVWNGSAAVQHPAFYGAAIAATVVVLRFCWTWPAAWLPRAVVPALRRRDPMPPARHLSFIAWSGMRGAISLAAALSIPALVQSRPLIVFITAAVIAVTLLVQGTSLPWVIPLLGLDADAAKEREETKKSEAEARIATAAAALNALKTQQGPAAEQLRQEYDLIANGSRSGQEIEAEAEVRRRAIAAQRRAIFEMHRKGAVNHAVLRRIERDLDLQEAALDNRLTND